jgi:hypothetical protein
MPMALGTDSQLVMAGLVPAIHVLLARLQKEDVDARHKAGHDGAEAVRLSSPPVPRT